LYVNNLEHQMPNSELKRITDTTANGIGDVYGRDRAGIAVIQLTVVGTGAVAATTQVYGSNDELGWVDLGSISASGTGNASISDTIEAPWRLIRADISGLTGTNARAIVTLNGV
jgi:hypothetical protein